MCPWEPKLSAYWDGELPPDEQGQLKAHLQTCTDCQATLAAWQRLRQRFQQDSMPTGRVAIATTLERLRRDGAIRPPLFVGWLERLDAWFARPTVSFGAAMTVALALALLLANAPNLPATVAKQVKERAQQAMKQWTPLPFLRGRD